MGIIEKCFTYIRSIFIILCLKIRYGKRLDMKLVNSIRGKPDFWIDKDSNIQIGNFLSVLGPTYFKVIKGGKLKIGNRCFFNRNCSITCMSNISIGDECIFANNLVIVDHDHNIYADKEKNPYVIKDIIIGNRVWVGANATILKGVTIGDDAVIAAGAVVTSDVLPNCVYGGVPARKIKEIS